MRHHRLILYGTKDTTTTPPLRPYQWRRNGRSRRAALLAAGLGTARRPPAPDGRHRDG